MLQMAIDAIGDKKIPITLAVACFMGFIALQQYVDLNYVSEAEAEQSMTSLAKKVDANGRLIQDHITEYKLGEVRKAIQNVRDQQSDLSLMVESSGETSLSKKRRKELNDRLRDLEKTERCIVEGGALCK